jgi:PilZ domain
MATRAREVRGEIQPPYVEQRSEPRFEGLVERAALSFRGADHIVPVINISSRGTMIESTLEPRLGESVKIRFEGCSPIYAFVRWAREGRIGLNFGCELILG